MSGSKSGEEDLPHRVGVGDELLHISNYLFCFGTGLEL